MLKFRHINLISSRYKGSLLVSQLHRIRPHTCIIQRNPLLFHNNLRYFSKNESVSSSTTQTINEITSSTTTPPLTTESTPPPPIPSTAVEKKATLWQRVKKEARHYWLGFKLFGLNIRTAYGIVKRILDGHEMSRRERRLLKGVIIDTFRLVPFSVFLIVPFMEFLLPIVVRLYPQMLPSTFDDKLHQQQELAKKVRAKIRVAKFLQESVEHLVRKHANNSENNNGFDVEEVMMKLRKGIPVDNPTIMKFARQFEDELTLDNLDRPQLTALCRFLSMKPYGSNTFLRTRLRNRINGIKRDDLLIYSEGGVEKLTKSELRDACLARGMKIWGSKERLQNLLSQWLISSVEQRVPPTLLIMSRALTIFEKDKSTEEGLKDVLSSLPEEVIDEIELQIADSRGERDRDLKLEVLQYNAEMVKEEREDVEKDEQGTNDDSETNVIDSEKKQEDLQVVAAAVEELLSGRNVDKQQLHDVKTRSEKLLREVLAVDETKQELKVETIVNKTTDSQQDEQQMAQQEQEQQQEEEEKIQAKVIIEIRKQEVQPQREEQVIVDESNTDDDDGKKKSKDLRVASRVSYGLNRIFNQLDTETEQVTTELGSAFRLLDLDGDGVLSQDELRSALIRLREKLSDDQIQQIISRLDDDHDGRISLEAILQYKESAASENDLIDEVNRLKQERDENKMDNIDQQQQKNVDIAASLLDVALKNQQELTNTNEESESTADDSNRRQSR